MKDINILKSDRAEKVQEMSVISAIEELTDEKRSEFDNLKKAVVTLKGDIERAETVDLENKAIVAETEGEKEVHENVDLGIGIQLRDALKSAYDTGSKTTLDITKYIERAGDFTTSTDSDLIEKRVGGIDVLTSPGIAFLKEIGCDFIGGLNANYSLPSMDADRATFPGEGVQDASADMTPSSNVLVARPLGHYQNITTAVLAQTNPKVYASIVQNLVDGIGNALAYDVFEQLVTDAPAQESALADGSAGIAAIDFTNMEASIGGLNIGAAKYVMTPTLKAWAKNAVQVSNISVLWNTTSNEVNGYKSFGVPCVQDNHLFFGDFSRIKVGEWGKTVLLIDPYTRGEFNEIVVRIQTLVDTGVSNPRAFTYIKDASIA